MKTPAPPAPDRCMTAQLERIVRALAPARYLVRSEDDLQRQVAFALSTEGIAAVREFVLSPRDRPDFFVPTAGPNGVAIELKLKCDAKELLRQVARYAQHQRVEAVVAASTSHHVLSLPQSVGGKPLALIHLRSF